jgi:hypothetical protein
MPEHNCEDEPRVKCCANPACGHVLGKLVMRPEMCGAVALYLTGSDVAIYDTEGECPKCHHAWFHHNSIYSLALKMSGRRLEKIT